MQVDLLVAILLAIISGLVCAAVAYHLRPRIVRLTGGVGDEAAAITLLEECKSELQEIKRELRHAQQLVEVYRELNERRRKPD
ncbi:MAG: hypothetical protein KC441_02455 [Anaerolineales bacterium]|nr:hypothetical protein [Anaerolineales bacterium]